MTDLDWEKMTTEELIDRLGAIRSNAGYSLCLMNQMPIGSEERAERNEHILACFANCNKIKEILLSRLTP